MNKQIIKLSDNEESELKRRLYNVTQFWSAKHPAFEDAIEQVVLSFLYELECSGRVISGDILIVEYIIGSDVFVVEIDRKY